MFVLVIIIFLAIFRSVSPFLTMGLGLNAHIGSLRGSFQIEAFENLKKQDLVYKTKREKYNAVIEATAKLVAEGRPVLIGTTTVDISELLSWRLLILIWLPAIILASPLTEIFAELLIKLFLLSTYEIPALMIYGAWPCICLVSGTPLSIPFTFTSELIGVLS